MTEPRHHPPTSAGAPRRDPVDLLIEQAELLGDTKRYDDALGRLGRAAALAPDDSRIPRMRSRILTRMNKPAEALRAAETAVGLEPDGADGHFLRAYALLGLSKRREALAAIHEAHRLAPTSPRVLGVMVTIELANRRRKEAEAAALRCLELAPDSTVAHDAIGQVALATRRWDHAEQAYRTLLSLAPTSATGLNNLALVCAARGDDEGAMGIYVRALNADPSFATARENLVESAHRFLWGNWLRLPNDARGGAWFAVAMVLVQPVMAAFFVFYALWFPFRAIRAIRRRPRIPPQARELVAEHERRSSIDAAATWGVIFGLYALALSAAMLTSGETSGPASLAVAVALIACSLSRVIPRVFHLDWPTRPRPRRVESAPWDRMIRF